MKLNLPKKSFISLFVFMLILIISCDQGIETNHFANGLSIQEGQLAFQDRSSLKNFMSNALKMEISSFRKSMHDYYQSGFKGLVAVDEQSSQNEILSYKSKKLKRLALLQTNGGATYRLNDADTSSVEVDDEDELIHDPYFATIIK